MPPLLAKLIQHVAKTQTASTTLVFTVAATRIGSRLTIAWANDGGGATPVVSIVGGEGTGAWTETRVTGQSHLISAIWSCICTASVTTVTITWNVSQTNASACFDEWAGPDDGQAVDQVLSSAGGNSTAPSVGPLTPTKGFELCIAMVAHRGVYSAGPSGGFADAGAEAKVGTVAVRSAFLVQGVAAAATCGWTLSAIAFWDTCMVSFPVEELQRPMRYVQLMPR